MKSKKRKINIKGIVFLLLLITSIITVGVIFKLNLLPNKYLTIVIIFYVIFNILNFLFLIKMKKLAILGYILSILFIIINILGSAYMIRTDSFISSSFGNSSNTYKTTYYVITNSQNDYQLSDLEGQDVKCYENSNNIDDAVNKLKENVNFTKLVHNDLNVMFQEVEDNDTKFVLLDASSYDLVFQINSNFKKADFKIVYQFDLEFPEEEALNLSDVGDSFNIYLEGKDFTYTNNDFNMIVSINLKKRKILLTSMPRDYYIEVYGKNGRKDTLSYMGAYGTSTSLKSLENLLNIDINYYVSVNTKSLVGLVDALGGITYCSDEDFTTTHALILDTYDDTKGEKLHVTKGCQTLNGIETLTVSRERLNITGGDTQRQKNCETIMEAILAKLKSTNTITNYSNVLNAISSLYTTNMPKETFTTLVKDILDNSNWNIDKYELNGTDAKDYVHLTNLIDWVMYPDEETVKQDQVLIHDLLN
jgi:LCP family protein required for cell wall assembly